MLGTKALQSSEIVTVTEFREQVLQDPPIAIAGVASVGVVEMVLQILLDAIVVEQRVIDVEQEDNRMRPVPFGTRAMLFAVREPTPWSRESPGPPKSSLQRASSRRFDCRYANQQASQRVPVNLVNSRRFDSAAGICRLETSRLRGHSADFKS